MPTYAREKPITENDVRDIVAWADLAVTVEPEQQATAILWWQLPDFARGREVPYLVLGGHIRGSTKLYIQLHEVHHVRRGDTDERTTLVHTCALPQCEPAADMFAMMGLLDRYDFEQGAEWLESRLWEIAPLNDKGWREHRRTDLAPRLVRMRKLVDEWLD